MKKSSLEQLQSEFKDYLYSGANEAKLASSVTSANNIDSILRLDVYRNAYYIRLQEALAHDFPVLLAVMGDETFGREMAAYLQAYPSTAPSLRYLGQHLSQWFYQLNKPALADFVKLEWAILKAFDSADADVLYGDSLQAIPTEQWEQLRFTFHPSVTLLDVGTNVMMIWNAYLRKKPLPGIQLDSPESLVVSRSRYGPVVQSISPVYHTFFEALAENKTFGVACEHLARLENGNNVPHIAAQCLSQALSNGWISNVQTGLMSSDSQIVPELGNIVLSAQ